jgi:hypothetical protein
MTEVKTVFQKVYDDETLKELEDDLFFRLGLSNLPIDENGFTKGEFIVIVKYSEEGF